MTMRTLSLSFLMICGLTFSSHWAAAQSRIAEVPRGASSKLDSERIEEIDPDLGGEVEPIEPALGRAAGGAVEDCHIIGAFTTQFTFPNRYRGNLYTIIDSGVFLKEISMQLALTGPVDLYVSVHRKTAAGTYEQLDINTASLSLKHIVLVGVTGNNQPAWFSSGLLNNGLGIELEPAQYAIGFAWGNSSVRFGRDSGQSYPKPFEVGTIAGSVSRELTGGEPPLGDSPSFSTFTGGVYAQELCFEPTEGACCLSDGANSRCENRLEVNCVGEGSFFHGQRTTCKDTLCEFGACCYDCDTAQNDFAAQCGAFFTQDSCDATGGIAFWSGVDCPADASALCPKRVGACCNGATCNLKCRDECLAGGGTYEGDGTNCDPDTHVCKGACCVTGGCFDRTQAGCAGSNGSFHGRGTRCIRESCGGACCYGFTTFEFCEFFDERELCAYDPKGFPIIAYKGDGTSCFNEQFEMDCGVVATYKACCLPNGECINTTSNVCNAPWIQGVFNSAATCSTVTCNVQRCCYPDGGCELITTFACQQRGGTPGGSGTTCTATGCNSAAGACCTATGQCSQKSPTQCTAEGGIYQGDTTVCSGSTCPGFGACCRGNGDCLERQTPAQCSAVNGAYGGAASVCASQTCDVRGACCAVTGSCLLTTAGTCAGIDGEFTCVGESCVPGLCVSGACCIPGQGCKKRTPSACAEESGTFKGPDTSCSPTTCLIQGACCDKDGCTIKSPSTCVSDGGIYAGDGTTCIVEACARASCCRIDETCEPDVLRAACQHEGEVFHDNQNCSNGACEPKGACCDDGECSITTEGACTSGSRFLGVGIGCGYDTCAPTGACCDDEACTVRTQVACGLAGGKYRGNDTTCVPNICLTGSCETTGACCTDGVCIESTADSCSGTYMGDGVSCSPNPCAQAPTGACCVAGQPCTITTQAACTGTYQGNNTTCATHPCPVMGACCNGTVCTETTQGACTGTYQGNNTTCTSNPCPATGACCNGAVCTETTQAECSGTYQGNGTDCSPNPCPTGGACTAILSSVPENCFVDPRRPYPPFQTGTSEGRTSVQLTLDCDTANHQPSDYAVTIDPAGPGPTVSSVLSGGTSITLTFSQPVPAGAWTCVRYVPTNLSQCFGFLPGDVSANRTTAPADLLTLIDDLNNVLVPELPLERCDIDRSGTCAPADLITLIDLLNGANSFIVWNQRMLPACPSAAP